MASAQSDQMHDFLKVSKIDVDPLASIEASIRRMTESNGLCDSSLYATEWELHEEARRYGEDMAAIIKGDEFLKYASSIETSIFDDCSAVADYQGEMSTSSYDGTRDASN